METNQHGIQGEWMRAGDLFAGKVFIPACCLTCSRYDPWSQYGEFGNRLGPPECKVMLRFPTKKGTCKRQKPA